MRRRIPSPLSVGSRSPRLAPVLGSFGRPRDSRDQAPSAHPRDDRFWAAIVSHYPKHPMSEQLTVADYIVGRLARARITDCFGGAGDFALSSTPQWRKAS
jgi:hypothetical protein